MAKNTRTVILQVARGLFTRQGYAATSLRQVAQRAGIAKATVYHHFPGKRAIMHELLAEAHAVMDRTRAALAEEKDPGTRLAAAARAALRFLAGYADLMQIARREVPGIRERQGTDVGRFMSAYEALIADAVAEGRRRGSFRSIATTDAARIFMTMLQGQFAYAMFNGEKPRFPEKAADALLDVYINGIAARPDRGKA